MSKLTRQNTLKRLERYIPDYKKNKNVNSILRDRLGNAVENAKKLNILHKKYNISLFSRESNPSTQVFKLVAFIHEIKKENMRLDGK